MDSQVICMGICLNLDLQVLSEPEFSGLVDFQDYEFVSPNCQSKIEVSSLQRTYDIPNPNPENLLILKILVQTIKSAVCS